MKNNIKWISGLYVALLSSLTGLLLPVAVWAQTQELCVSQPTYASTTSGGGIIDAIFTAINTILNAVAGKFYDALVSNPSFGTLVNALLILYVVIYGIMIMFNLASVHTAEVVNRFFKIGLIYAIVSPNLLGWQFFYQWIGGLFMGGMNELIIQFSNAGISGTLAQTPTLTNAAGATSLNVDAMGAMMGPLNYVFSVKFVVCMLALFFTGAFGWLLMLLLMWGLIEFIFMLIASIATYVKSMVGLAFLFALAPIFFLFLVFEKTRQVFMGWLNQVVSFALTPVLLFAFLAFYMQLINASLFNLLWGPGSPDICWVKWFSLPGGLMDIYWWRFTRVAGVPAAGAAAASTAAGGDWGFASPPISITGILYFLLLCHLGKSFSEFIEQIAQDLSGGIGPGVVKASTIKDWAKNNFTGGRGTAGMAAAGVGSAVGAGKWGLSKITGGRFGGGGGAAGTRGDGTAPRPGVGEGATSVGGRESAAAGGVGALHMGGGTHLDDAMKGGWLAQKRGITGGKAAPGAVPPKLSGVQQNRPETMARTDASGGQTVHLARSIAGQQQDLKQAQENVKGMSAADLQNKISSHTLMSNEQKGLGDKSDMSGYHKAMADTYSEELKKRLGGSAADNKIGGDAANKPIGDKGGRDDGNAS